MTGTKDFAGHPVRTVDHRNWRALTGTLPLGRRSASPQVINGDRQRLPKLIVRVRFPSPALIGKSAEQGLQCERKPSRRDLSDAIKCLYTPEPCFQLGGNVDV
jgi:hypothetical protein